MQFERLGAWEIAFAAFGRFWPVWAAMALLLVLSYAFRRRLGLYGHLFETYVGIAAPK